MGVVGKSVYIAGQTLVPLPERRNLIKVETNVQPGDNRQTLLIVRWFRKANASYCPSRMCQALTICSFTISDAAPALAQNVATEITGKYVPSPMEVPSLEVWVGFLAGVIPFAIASVEFSKRIIIQRRCKACGGRGLVQNSNGRFRKCTQCGGLLPWLGWRAFWLSNMSPGNGGPLLQPKGQRTVLYRVPEAYKEEDSSDDNN